MAAMYGTAESERLFGGENDLTLQGNYNKIILL